MSETNTAPHNRISAVAQDDDLAIVQRLREARDRVKTEMAKVVVGQEEIIDGMLIGLLNFTIRQRVLEGRADPPNPERLARPLFAGLNREWLVYIGSVIPVALTNE